MTMERVENRLGGQVSAAVETLHSAALDGFLTTEPGSAVPTVWPSETGFAVADLVIMRDRLEQVVVPALNRAIGERPADARFEIGGQMDEIQSTVPHSA